MHQSQGKAGLWMVVRLMLEIVVAAAAGSAGLRPGNMRAAGGNPACRRRSPAWCCNSDVSTSDGTESLTVNYAKLD